LLAALQNGHEGIVELLLKHKGGGQNYANWFSSSEVLLASDGGYEGTVRLLLEMDNLSLNSQDFVGKSR
jgi:hypothetical protein